MQKRQRFNTLRALILLGPIVGTMVISVAQADLSPSELVNSGLIISAVIIGFIMFFGGGDANQLQGDSQTDSLPPTAPPTPYMGSWPEERDRLRLENAALKGQVQAMQVVFQYLDIRVTVKR